MSANVAFRSVNAPIKKNAPHAVTTAKLPNTGKAALLNPSSNSPPIIGPTDCPSAVSPIAPKYVPRKCSGASSSVKTSVIVNMSTSPTVKMTMATKSTHTSEAKPMRRRPIDSVATPKKSDLIGETRMPNRIIGYCTMSTVIAFTVNKYANSREPSLNPSWNAMNCGSVELN